MPDEIHLNWGQVGGITYAFVSGECDVPLETMVADHPLTRKFDVEFSRISGSSGQLREVKGLYKTPCYGNLRIVDGRDSGQELLLGGLSMGNGIIDIISAYVKAFGVRTSDNPSNEEVLRVFKVAAQSSGELLGGGLSQKGCEIWYQMMKASYGIR